MVDTIAELADLSRRLNQSSDKVNSIISTVNKKLATLNFGVEAWTQRPIESGDFERLDPGQESPYPRQKDATYLGYCKVEDEWQLAVKNGTLLESDGDRGPVEELTDVEYRPLLKTARETRSTAVRFVPELLDEIKIEAETLLRSIEQAEKAAAKL